MNEASTALFDSQDLDYLVTNLTSEQLRKELHNADIQQGVARFWGENDNLAYWKHYSDACLQALRKQRDKRLEQFKGREGSFSIEAIKEKNDIVDIISRYTNLRKAGKEYTGKCPFHQDNHPSLQVNQDKQLFYCFSCQGKGDVIDFIKQIENLDTKQACLFLNGEIRK